MADTSFNSQSKTLRNLVLSAKKQAAWGGALADASLTQRQRFDGGGGLELTQTRRDDGDYAGRGTFFATNGQVTSWAAKMSSMKAELSPWLAGWLFAFALGTDTVTGDAAPYTHSFAYDESTRTPPATTAYCEDTEDVHYKIPDLAINDVTLTISDISSIVAEWNMTGTGLYVPGTMAALPALPDEDYLLGSDCSLSYGPTGNLTSFLGRHMNTTFKWDNQLVEHRAPGLGMYAGFVRKGTPQYDFQATIAAKDTDDTWTNFLNDTESGLVYTINSGANAQLVITVSAAHLKSTKIGADGDMTIWNLEMDQTTTYKRAGVQPVTVQVINSTAAYLAAA